MSNNATAVPAALRKAGITQVNTNCAGHQTIALKNGALGLFFGDELAQRLLAKQNRKEQAHG